MSKLIKSILIAVAVAAVAGYGTYSFFSDKETSKDNTFTAGAIDLSLGGQFKSENGVNGNFAVGVDANNNNRALYNFTDLKPGDKGDGTFDLSVTSNDAYVCARSTITSTPENGATEPEIQAGDNTADGANDGELQNYLRFATYADTNGNGQYDANEPINIGQYNASPTYDGITVADMSSAGWIPVAEHVNFPNTWLTLDTVPKNTLERAGMMYCFGKFTHTGSLSTTVVTGCDGTDTNNDQNKAQTDKVIGDIEFYAVQSRNNTNFTCASMNTPKVGAKLSAYVAPSCTTTVTGTESVQTAINSAAAGSTICVDSGYTGAGDTGAIQVNKDGDILAATTQGVAIHHPVELDNNLTKVTGFLGTVAQVESPAEVAAFYFNSTASNATVSYNTVTSGVGAGVMLESGGTLGGGLIANNDLSGATQGIYTNVHTGNVTIEYNDIHNNAAGIGGVTGVTVQYNEFTGATTGQEAMGADSSYNSGTTNISFNNFLNGSKINTYSSGTVIAKNNFFNLTGATQETGETVDFTPETASQYPHN